MRKKILAALKGCLETITTANGYNYTITTVTRVLRDVRDVPESKLPMITIMPLDSRLVVVESLEWSWNIALFYYFQLSLDVSETGTLSAQAEDMIEDIETRINTFYTYNAGLTAGNKVDIESIQVDSIEPYLPLAEGIGFLVVNLKINYIGG